VVIPARDDRGDPLPPGEYLFTLSVTRTQLAYVRSSWFARTLADLVVPFTVGRPPARKAAVVSTSLPASLESGAAETVVVRLRNDGAAAWRAGQTWLCYHWVKRSDDLLAPEVTGEVAVWQGARAELPREVPPGEVISVMIPVAAADEQGQPLAAPRPEDDWHYALQWDLVGADNEWFSKEGGPAGEETIDVVSRDPGVVFESVSAPREVEPGGAPEADVTVANAGAKVWQRGESAIVSRWYRWDGRPVPGRALMVPLPLRVAPGERLEIRPRLMAPLAPGPYWVTWTLAANGSAGEAASLSAGRRADLFVTPVFVRSAGVRTLDLSPYANIAGIAVDSYRARGDFDGRGASLPAEWLPPDQSGAPGKLYPAGYYAPAPALASPPFAFPEKSAGVGLVVACTGQTIALGEAGAARVHLIAASTEGDQKVFFRLNLKSGSGEEAGVVVPSWDHRAEGAPPACYVPYLRTLSGDDAARQAYLHYLSFAPTTPAVSLELPKAPWVKIIAITIETN
jgi:hypothetical protein